MLQSRSEVGQLVTQAQATPNPHCLLVCAFWGERLESSKVCLSLIITSYSEGMELLCSFLLVSLHPCVFPVSLDHFLPQTQVHLPLRVPTWPLFSSSKFSHIAPHYYTKTQGLSLCKFAEAPLIPSGLAVPPTEWPCCLPHPSRHCSFISPNLTGTEQSCFRGFTFSLCNEHSWGVGSHL